MEVRYNKMSKLTLNMKSPNEVEIEKLSKLMRDTEGDKVFEALPISRII